MTIICHVSDKKLDILIPQELENAICFSENKFITYFGQYLYLFDLEVMIENFNIQRMPTTGLYSHRFLHGQPENIERLAYRSQSLGWEWRCFEPVDVEKFSLGVLEHWNHMRGIVGKGTVEGKMTEMAIDLMRQTKG